MQDFSAFELVRDTLVKSGVTVITCPLSAPASTVWSHTPQSVLSGALPSSRHISHLLGKVEERVIYKMTDDFEFCYIYLLLPQSGELFFMGPYLPTAISRSTMLALPAAQNLSEEERRVLSRFCDAIPIIPDDSHFFFLLDTFCEGLWGAGNFSVVDVKQEKLTPPSPINTPGTVDRFDALQLDMELMEQRYKYENELIRAVSLGQSGKANLILAAFSETKFEKRTADDLRNLKNYCIIMNTLLRKAAEQGGVHPVYIDRVSSSFAVEIEKVQTSSAVAELMRDMFRSYCRVVRRHSMRDYSPLVQNAIILIESDLSANLTLSSLVSALKVSSGYLSTAFKRETGKTVTEFIRDKRMKNAEHLLATTRLQIQTVAAQSGILDLQYFYKLFKRHTGFSPKEYREKMKQ